MTSVSGIEQIEEQFLKELYNLKLEDLEKVATIKDTENINDSILDIFVNTSGILKTNEKDLESIYDKLQARVSSSAVSVVSSPTSSPISSVASRSSSPDNIQEGLKKVATDKVITSVVENNVQNTAIGSVNDSVSTSSIQGNIKDIATNTLSEVVKTNIELEKEKFYADAYPRKKVGIENSYKGGKVYCYANAAIQMLYSLPFLRRYYIYENHDEHENISDLIKQMNDSVSGNISPDTEKTTMCPKIIKEMVVKNLNKKVEQEDSQEYLNMYLDYIKSKEYFTYETTVTNKCSNGETFTEPKSTENTMISLEIKQEPKSIKDCMKVSLNEIKNHSKDYSKTVHTNVKNYLPLNKRRFIENMLMIEYKDNKFEFMIGGFESINDFGDTLLEKMYFVLEGKNFNDNKSYTKKYKENLFDTIINIGLDETDVKPPFKTIMFNLLKIPEKEDIDIERFYAFLTCIKENLFYFNKKYPLYEQVNDYIKRCNNLDEEKLIKKTKLEEFINFLDENEEHYLAASTSKKTEIIFPLENRYFFIQLKRFDNARKKIKGSVEPNKTLIIGGVKYTLSGVIIHTGNTIAHGHYIYYQCNESGDFIIKYDDDHVTPFDKSHDEEDIINKNGYIFAYTRYPVKENNQVEPNPTIFNFSPKLHS